VLKVNVCCSGSSGSTLLGYLLDGHPSIYSGPELNLFTKLALYERYDLVKFCSTFLCKYGLESYPFSETKPFFDNLDRYGISQEKAWGWVNSSKNLKELSECFQQFILEKSNKKIWVEKTPRNARVIKTYMDTFPEGKVIHIIRDPRDVILSLERRGFSFLKSCEIWLAAVAAVDGVACNSNLLEIRYEDLVTDKLKTMRSVCDFLNIDFQEVYFESDRFRSRGFELAISLCAWENRISTSVATSSVGKYNKQLSRFDSIYDMKVTDAYAKAVGCEVNTNIRTLMEKYKYIVPLRENKTVGYKWRNYEASPTMKRSLLNAIFHQRYYPILKYLD